MDIKAFLSPEQKADADDPDSACYAIIKLYEPNKSLLARPQYISKVVKSGRVNLVLPTALGTELIKYYKTLDESTELMDHMDFLKSMCSEQYYEPRNATGQEPNYWNAQAVALIATLHQQVEKHKGEESYEELLVDFMVFLHQEVLLEEAGLDLYKAVLERLGVKMSHHWTWEKKPPFPLSRYMRKQARVDIVKKLFGPYNDLAWQVMRSVDYYYNELQDDFYTIEMPEAVKTFVTPYNAVFVPTTRLPGGGPTNELWHPRHGSAAGATEFEPPKTPPRIIGFLRHIEAVRTILDCSGFRSIYKSVVASARDNDGIELGKRAFRNYLAFTRAVEQLIGADYVDKSFFKVFVHALREDRLPPENRAFALADVRFEKLRFEQGIGGGGGGQILRTHLADAPINEQNDFITKFESMKCGFIPINFIRGAACNLLAMEHENVGDILGVGCRLMNADEQKELESHMKRLHTKTQNREKAARKLEPIVERDDASEEELGSDGDGDDADKGDEKGGRDSSDSSDVDWKVGKDDGILIYTIQPRYMIELGVFIATAIFPTGFAKIHLVAKYSVPLLSALMFCHSNEIIHRDV